mmetsp:Transcript_19793/g.31153  ORF Transcript_19793/g.31153 Transcript_19793/m.31153 type:complete len:196 (+) Transcript_19793:157-744(+)
MSSNFRIDALAGKLDDIMRRNEENNSRFNTPERSRRKDAEQQLETPLGVPDELGVPDDPDDSAQGFEEIIDGDGDVLFAIDIEDNSGETFTLEFRQGDKVENVVSAFFEEHGLDEALKDQVQDMISAHVEQYIYQEAQPIRAADEEEEEEEEFDQDEGEDKEEDKEELLGTGPQAAQRSNYVQAVQRTRLPGERA